MPQGDENALTSAIATMGPISVWFSNTYLPFLNPIFGFVFYLTLNFFSQVGIDASQRSFQLYKSGVYDDPSKIFSLKRYEVNLI